MPFDRRAASCYECIFFEPYTPEEGKALTYEGTCNRYAPKPVATPANSKEIEKGLDKDASVPVTLWPNVQGLDWCGEFIANPNPTP